MDEILRLKQITGLTALFQDIRFGRAWIPEGDLGDSSPEPFNDCPEDEMEF